MSLTEIVSKYYSYTLEKIQKTKSNKEKREAVTEIIMNLIETEVKFSIRSIAKALNVSRKLVKNVLFGPLAFYFKYLLFSQLPLKKETRGRKKIEEKHPEIIQQIKDICESFEHVDKSLQDEIIYIDITLSGIEKKLKEKYNYSKEDCPCRNTIRRILITKLNYKITKVKKNKVYKKIPETDAIFANKNLKMKELEYSENTIGISIDDKVSKYIGCLSGGGYSWKRKSAHDHDTTPDYIVKPFGIKDLKTKETFVYCTTSNSTADYKVDCIEEYLRNKLKQNSNIEKLMIFLDNGPENSSRRKLWMYRIIKLSTKYEIKIELVYFPPYHSKYNVIERFWGTLQKHWGGLIIDTLDKLIGAINSCTHEGINARGYLRTKEYETGVKVDEKELKLLKEEHIIYENEGIKKWSVLVTP